MYELILMAALGGGSASPAWCGPGAPVVVSGGCFGSGCYGSWPASGGCWGSGCWGSAGCWGGGGCWGTWSAGGCWGSLPQTSGCYGSGWGGVVNLGCYGSTAGAYGLYRPYPVEGLPAAPEAEDVVIQDESGVIASSPAAHAVSPTRTAKAEPARPSREPTESIGPPEELEGPARATLVVHLPAEARVTINDAVTRLTSDTRTFVSPPLKRGEEYHYTLKAELTRDGRTLTSSKRVSVRAGEEKQVTLTFPPAAGVVQR
jgi:uncharacterized protein (TIGR03000 family)